MILNFFYVMEMNTNNLEILKKVLLLFDKKMINLKNN